MKHRFAAALAAALVTVSAAGCSLDSKPQSAGEVNVVIGYQSKTINTSTAGALLKAKGFLEKRLDDITKRTNVKYTVQWQDYDTGAPITAQMLAEKIDIGSMGDYPLLINGSKTQANERAKTEFVSITGYNAKGALNMVVVSPNSPDRVLTDLRGQKVSASVGSAGHGTLVRALTKAGIDPKTGVEVLNQQPQIGASALESGQVQAFAQFVAWPGLLAFQNKGRLLFDGAELDVPTFHGVVVRRDYVAQHPEVLDAFLQAQIDATDFLHEKPLEAAKLVADGSGLPQEVVYLYNGPGGAVSFDPTVKQSLVDAFKSDIPYLKSIGDFADLNIDQFVNDAPLRKAYADRNLNYDAQVAATTNPITVGGQDPVCNVAVTDPALAGELWIEGQPTTQPAANPGCLLRALREANAKGEKVIAAYIPDTELGTRWFADRSVWVQSPAANNGYLPFDTEAGAQRYIAAHPDAKVVDYQAALAGAV